MKNILSVFLILVVLKLFNGCEKPEQNKTENTKSAAPLNNINLEKFGGMFLESADTKKLILCGNNSEFIVSDESDFSLLDNSYPGLRKRNGGKKFYTEAEGFRSVKENLKTKNLDTIIVITKFIKIDTVFDCGK